MLHFKNTSSDKSLLDILALFGRSTMPPWLKTLSTGALEAGMANVRRTVNRLSLNLSKTCYSIFGGKSKINTGLRLYVDGQEVQKTRCCKYLGILIDGELKWCDHINYIYNKLVKFVSIFLQN